jgi:hypothetical protein
MKIVDGKITYENNDERMMAIGSVIQEVFARPVGFILIVQDFIETPAPISVDNYDTTENALKVLKAILENYRDAQARTYRVKEDGTQEPIAPRPMPTDYDPLS